MEDAQTPMEKYHNYLSSNYDGGCERFFSPTGFLLKFQRAIEVQTQKIRSSSYATSVDDAASKLRPILEGQEGVYDLCALPGTGKTSMLPFRFPTKRVLVAAPTPFDAWSAYNMATGDCSLHLKGLRLGDNKQVVYTDSYMASYILLTGMKDFDVLLVDECDSDRGVTKFLAEVKLPDKYLVRMSATIDQFSNKRSDGFRITDHDDMPDIRQSVSSLAEYIRRHHSGRSMVIAPDADSAETLHEAIPGSIAVHTKSNLGNIAKAMVGQRGQALFIADDTCARGLNLNLDNFFDTQLVSEYSQTRVVTSSEAYQRRHRVGRNRDGHYFSPALKFRDKGTSDIDIYRHNVVRALAEIPQQGSTRLHVSRDDAQEFMEASREPYEIKLRQLAYESAVTTSSGSPPRSSSSSSFKSTVESSSRVVSPPAWLAFFGGGTDHKTGFRSADSYVVKRRSGYAMERRRSSGAWSSGSDTCSVSARSAAVSVGVSALGADRARRSRAVMRTHPDLPSVESAPYAVSRRSARDSASFPSVPVSPPLMDLTGLTYDMDWPSLIRDRMSTGTDLPTLVPPGSWRHTSSVGLGTDWFRRLDDMAHRDNDFDDREFEVVCRAWNKLVGQAWVRRTPGLSSEHDFHRMEYCMRYFQSYFLLSSAG